MRVMPVAEFLIVTSALATPPPDGSVIVPESVAPTTWATSRGAMTILSSNAIETVQQIEVALLLGKLTLLRRFLRLADAEVLTCIRPPQTKKCEIRVKHLVGPNFWNVIQP